MIAGAGAAGVALLWAGREPIAEVAGDVADGLGEQADEVTGGSSRERPTAVAVADIPTFTTLAGARLVYEINDRPSTFAMEAQFAQQLDASLASHWEAAGWGVPAQLTTYGTWIRYEGEERPSWHHAGRAFDVGRIVSEAGVDLASCRYDVWSTADAATRQRHATAYWRLAATVHRDFDYVLTYLYNTAHHNHIHLDNGRSGGGRSTFRRGSRLQVQAVQAMCRHVWNIDVSVTNRWDGATRDAVDQVLDRIGVRGRLTDQEVWHAFCSATARGA